MKTILFYIIFTTIGSMAMAQMGGTGKQFAAMCYNVENLFDTIDNPLTSDEEFLPLGKNEWTGARLQRKLNNLASVIVAAGKGSLPDVVGMVEVETGDCVQMLVMRTILSNKQYRYIHFESPDPRGIDVALLYNAQTVTPLSKQAIRITFPFAPNDRTRDLLYVSLKTALFDTLHVVVAHLPSRRGGKTKSDAKRMFVAQRIKQLYDSIHRQSARAAVLIMGDFNDRPSDESITTALAVSYDTNNRQHGQLYGLLQESADEGSYKFQGRWQEIDHFFVSSKIISPPFRYTARIVKEAFMLESDGRNAGQKPFRTYNGPRYSGGYSDHLPIYLQITKE